MSDWMHVEDVAPRAETMWCWSGSKTDPKRLLSTTTLGLTVWRCRVCRALAVTSAGLRPSGDCGKCPR